MSEENQQQGSPTPPARPEWLPEKFWDSSKGAPNVEALAKSYTEIESTVGKLKAQEGSPPAPKDNNELSFQAPAGTAVIDEVVSKVKSGDLTEEDYASFANKGLTREHVDRIARGERAAAEAYTQKVYQAVGGKEQFEALASWAVENLPKEQLEAYNQANDAGDFATTSLLLAGIQRQFFSKNPRFIEGGPAVASDSGPYKDASEMKADMAKPEYAKSPEFRAKVARRLAMSGNL